MGSLKEKTARGLFWGGLSNGIQQLLNMVFGVFLARMLNQSDYGVIGMLAIFSALATTLQGGGFISAINRKKTVDYNDYNAVFWTSALTGLTLYLILFFSAPLIARFYGVPELLPLARYSFLGFLIASLGVAPGAYLFRNMMVRESAILAISSVFISGIVGLCMAANGFSYWGLATQNTVCILVGTILSFYFSKWRPSLKVDFSPIKEMLVFSSKLIFTNIFNIVNSNIFSVLLGKLYTPHDVGNYTQANKWNNIGHSFVSNMLSGIAQPVFAKTTEDKDRQRQIFRKLLRFTAFVSFPAMFGLALVSEEFIVMLLTEKWAESARLLQILCIAGAFIPLSNLFSNLIISRGKSSVYMWCSMALCIVQLIAALLSARYGIIRMLQVYVVINIGWLLVWHYFARREINIRIREVVADISPYLLLTVSLAVAAILLTQSVANLYLRFTLKVVFVATAYCLVLWCLGSTIFKESVNFIRKREIHE
jgi:O-antigen/teichoic acid export membrane protein